MGVARIGCNAHGGLILTRPRNRTKMRTPNDHTKDPSARSVLRSWILPIFSTVPQGSPHQPKMLNLVITAKEPSCSWQRQEQIVTRLRCFMFASSATRSSGRILSCALDAQSHCPDFGRAEIRDGHGTLVRPVDWASHTHW